MLLWVGGALCSHRPGAKEMAGTLGFRRLRKNGDAQGRHPMTFETGGENMVGLMNPVVPTPDPDSLSGS